MDVSLPNTEEAHFAAPERKLPRFLASAADNALLSELRSSLTGGGKPDRSRIRAAVEASGFRQDCREVALILYQAGEPRLMVVRRTDALWKGLGRAVAAMLRHPRFGNFNTHDLDRCRLQMDILPEKPKACDIRRIGMIIKGDRHFEIGLDGLVLVGKGKRNYFLPGDAYVRSVMSMRQLRNHLVRGYGDTVLDDYAYFRFTSESYISYGGTWLRLYRGHPVNGALTRARLEEAVHLGLAHVHDNMQPDGRFLYYYDSAKDSRRDHEHPRRDPDKNPYYNILRHSGGILACLYYARLYDDVSLLPAVRAAIDYLMAQTRSYTTGNGEKALYVYYNKKAKLGGSGIALYALVEYRKLTGDGTHDEAIHLLARHLLEQITESGEFMYYNIYLDREVEGDKNAGHFNFFYPGEALCGLAGYHRHVLDDRTRSAPFLEAVHRAMHFLMVDRPKIRAEHYTVLPSDGWLMMAINEFWEEPAFRKDLYCDSVFADADAMVRRMYRVTDAPYPDYAGAFYYKFDDYPYADGARCEGLMAAYELAHKIGDTARITLYERALRLSAWATLHLVNTPASLYPFRNPAAAVGGIRFKYTRQWFRVDTIQHVVSFYMKLMLHGRCPIEIEPPAA